MWPPPDAARQIFIETGDSGINDSRRTVLLRNTTLKGLTCPPPLAYIPATTKPARGKRAATGIRENSMLDKRLLLLAAPLALVACGDKSSAPSGQVVATVNGEEITTTDLDSELNGATAPTPEGQKQLQRMALENIINRTILAQAAEKEGLAKGPEFAVIERKAKQAALVELLQRNLGKSLPQPSNEEVDNFVAENPSLFSNRKVFVVDQIVVPQVNQQLLKALEPVKTLAEAQAVLQKFNVQGNQTVGVIDSLTIPPQAATQIGNLPPDEVFIIPANGAIRINHVRSSQVDPISGDQAKQIAKEMLTRQRGQTAMQTTLGDKIKAGRANVKYNDAFAPPKGAAAGAAPAGAAPAGAATPASDASAN
jgi:EpsD family peptidyl-prolyl cis-trans isomerase